MSRIFTKKFHYKGTAYTAVLAQTDRQVRLFLPDEQLHNILPGGKITIDWSPGTGQNMHVSTRQKELLLCIFDDAEIRRKLDSFLNNGQVGV